MDFKELVLHVSVQYPSVFANITADNFSENMPDFYVCQHPYSFTHITICSNTITSIL